MLRVTRLRWFYGVGHKIAPPRSRGGASLSATAKPRLHRALSLARPVSTACSIQGRSFGALLADNCLASCPIPGSPAADPSVSLLSEELSLHDAVSCVPASSGNSSSKPHVAGNFCVRKHVLHSVNLYRTSSCRDCIISAAGCFRNCHLQPLVCMKYGASCKSVVCSLCVPMFRTRGATGSSLPSVSNGSLTLLVVVAAPCGWSAAPSCLWLICLASTGNSIVLSRVSSQRLMPLPSPSSDVGYVRVSLVWYHWPGLSSPGFMLPNTSFQIPKTFARCVLVYVSTAPSSTQCPRCRRLVFGDASLVCDIGSCYSEGAKGCCDKKLLYFSLYGMSAVPSKVLSKFWDPHP